MTMDSSPATDSAAEQTSVFAADSATVEEDPNEWRRRQNSSRRSRLLAEINGILRSSRAPLRDVIRDHALHRLPAQSLLRFCSVSAEWNRLISSPIFAHTQSHTHLSPSGVFHQSTANSPEYSPFDASSGAVPDPSLTFLPTSFNYITIIASSNGLLCCRGLLHSYYICNPSTAEWTALPELPLRPHIDDVAVALVFDPSLSNLNAVYRVIVAYEIVPDCPGVYGFRIFSSETGEWAISPEVVAAEQLLPGSGVSAGGAAYWRSSMQEAVGFDPTAGVCRSVPWPLGYDPSASWALGEMGGRLCCTCVTDEAVEVYKLGPSDQWCLMRSFKVFRSRPWPLRFQSGVDLEVMMWAEGKVVLLDIAGEGRLKGVCAVAAGPHEEYVPHISTFARVFPQVHQEPGK